MDHQAGLVALETGDDKARKSRSGSEIDPLPRIGRKAGELGAVRHMARPGVLESRRSDEILRRLPPGQKRDILVKKLRCFT
jgi:hypothetical protein